MVELSLLCFSNDDENDSNDDITDILALVAGGAVADGEAAGDEVILDIHDDDRALGSHDLKRAMTTRMAMTMTRMMKAVTFLIHMFQQKTNSWSPMLPSPEVLKMRKISARRPGSIWRGLQVGKT